MEKTDAREGGGEWLYLTTRPDPEPFMRVSTSDRELKLTSPAME